MGLTWKFRLSCWPLSHLQEFTTNQPEFSQYLQIVIMWQWGETMFEKVNLWPIRSLIQGIPGRFTLHKRTRDDSLGSFNKSLKKLMLFFSNIHFRRTPFMYGPRHPSLHIDFQNVKNHRLILLYKMVGCYTYIKNV